MNTKDYIALGGIIGPIIGAVVVLALKDLRVFQPSPDFSIKFETLSHVDKTYKLTVENVGRAQAKNANVSIVSSNSIGVRSIFCPEGRGSAADQSVLSTFRFALMSTNVQCQIQIKDSSKNVTSDKTYYFSVSADDAPGRQLIVPLPQQDEKSETTTIIPQVLLDSLFMIFTSITVAMASWLYQRFAKRRKETQRLKEREVGLEQEIKQATEELEFLERSTTGQENIPDTQQDRMQSLEDRISRLGESLAQVRGMVQTSDDTRVLVGDFFTKWATLERELLRIAEKQGFDVKRPNPGRTAEYLYGKEALPGTFIENFEKVRGFRNRLAHGALVPSESDLKDKISELDKLLKHVKDKMMT